eukprot:4842682-Pleurochrysis_carterae.AAC.3
MTAAIKRTTLAMEQVLQGVESPLDGVGLVRHQAYEKLQAYGVKPIGFLAGAQRPHKAEEQGKRRKCKKEALDHVARLLAELPGKLAQARISSHSFQNRGTHP